MNRLGLFTNLKIFAFTYMLFLCAPFQQFHIHPKSISFYPTSASTFTLITMPSLTLKTNLLKELNFIQMLVNI